LLLEELASSSGNKRRLGKWKRMNPKIWEKEYGLINVIETYYQKRKLLYTSLFERPINAMA
jgi:hypothetical protein